MYWFLWCVVVVVNVVRIRVWVMTGGWTTDLFIWNLRMIAS